MGKEERRKMKRTRRREKERGLEESGSRGRCKAAGETRGAARRRKEKPGKGNGPKGRRWVCPTLALL